MAKIDKLIQKAISSPQNIKFDELCILCRRFGFTKESQEGSHIIYRRHTQPKRMISVQSDHGKAKPYQVNQLLDWARENSFLEEDA